MIGLKTFIVASLATLALAEPSAPGIKTYFKNEGSRQVQTLKTNSAAKTFTGPDVDASSISANRINSRITRGLTRRFEIEENVCLDPVDTPIPDDCASLCENMNEQQGPLLLQPFDTWFMEAGHCAFGLVNLEPCSPVNIDPLNTLAVFCNSMYQECAMDGYDGFVSVSDPKMAFAMSGVPAAPPYEEGPC